MPSVSVSWKPFWNSRCNYSQALSFSADQDVVARGKIWCKSYAPWLICLLWIALTSLAAKFVMQINLKVEPRKSRCCLLLMPSPNFPLPDTTQARKLKTTYPCPAPMSQYLMHVYELYFTKPQASFLLVGAKFLVLYKRGGHRVLINNVGDMICRPNPMEAAMRLVPCSGSVSQHLLTSYMQSLLSVLLAQFSYKRLSGGMTGVVALVKNSVPIKVIIAAPSSELQGYSGKTQICMLILKLNHLHTLLGCHYLWIVKVRTSAIECQVRLYTIRITEIIPRGECHRNPPMHLIVPLSYAFLLFGYCDGRGYPEWGQLQRILMEEAGLELKDLLHMTRWGQYAPRVADVAKLPITGRRSGAVTRDLSDKHADDSKGKTTRYWPTSPF